VPNGKPLGRHVKTSGGGRHVLRVETAPIAPPHPVPALGTRYRVAVKAMAVMSLSSGMIGTVALPAYAVDPDEQNAGRQSAGREPDSSEQPAGEPQTVIVAADAEPVEAARDDIGATTVEELEAKREREEAERRAREAAEREAEAAREAAAPSTGQSTGGSGAERGAAATAAPAPNAAAAAPSADGGSIVSVARQFLGVPYVFGGASPSGFDCSGLVLYVYAKFGISLPHSSLAQGANGTRVSDPVPGDLVVIDGGNHIGIYTGGGNMIDAPMPGRVVNERPIYTANHYFVRY
jgi:cell wall-associated NlpC family hydrolase